MLHPNAIGDEKHLGTTGRVIHTYGSNFCGEDEIIVDTYRCYVRGWEIVSENINQELENITNEVSSLIGSQEGDAKIILQTIKHLLVFVRALIKD